MVIGGFSLEPRQAGAFCPGFAKTSAGGVRPALLHKPTLTLGECGSQESLEVQRRNSDVLNTPSPKIPLINSPTPPPPQEPDRLPDSVCEPTPTPCFTIDYSPGWNYVLEGWFKNMKTSGLVGSNFWVAGSNGEAFTLTSDGNIEATPKADAFPLFIMEGLPPEPEPLAVTSPPPGAAPTPCETPAPQVKSTVPGSGQAPPEMVEDTELDEESAEVPKGSHRQPVTPQVEHKEPPKAQSMYDDGTYWKKLISISRFDIAMISNFIGL